MSEKSVAQKLMIKEGRKVLFVNPPKSYKSTLGELPPNVSVLKGPKEPVDIIQVFVTSRKELEEQLPRLKAALAPKGILWVSFLKGTSKLKGQLNINRDSIAEYAETLGLEGVATISVDDDWSGLRFKVV
jgi:predicted CoA-binding protein